MYGDPRGYKHNGPPEWYHYTPNLFTDRLAEIYFWSMDRRDLARVPIEGFLAWLEGKDPAYPERALRADLERVRRKVEEFRADTTTPETRLADYLLDFNPAATEALLNLTMGAYFSRGRIWSLHARFRYFDPARSRAGLPDRVAALVERLSANGAVLTLVNLDPVEPRTVVVQAGAYAEHRLDSVLHPGGSQSIGSSRLTVHLNPGAGARLQFQMSRYVSNPAL
jgi:hypothetical protein